MELKMSLNRLALAGIIALIPLLAFQPSAVAATASYSVNGRGQGHGVGLDLASSKGMADAGYGYQDILKQFYLGAAFGTTSESQSLRVGVYSTTGSVSISSPGAFTVRDATGATVWTGAANQWIAVSHVGGVYNYSTSTGVSGSSRTVLRFYPSSPAVMRVLNLSFPNSFRESIVVQYSSDSGRLWAINELSLDKYLSGLADVTDSWPPEAMKAVSVAARTFVLEKKSDALNPRQNDGFDITATADGPIYLGYDYEVSAPNFKTAVDATRGQILVNGVDTVKALYHANSGGHTENYENVFAEASLPYLQGVPANGYEWSASSSWSLFYAANDLENRLKQDGRTDFTGELQGFRTTKVGVSPRVLELEILSSRGSWSKSGSDFQAALGLKSQWFRFQTVYRLFGGDRYATAADISAHHWKSSNTVILASGADFADAMAGVPLAVKKLAPILLTDPSRLSPAASAELSRLGAETVIILGGQGAVSARVAEEIESLNVTVERLAGVDRYWTAYAIAKAVDSPTGQAAIATGDDFPDGLSISSYAGSSGIPILFARQGVLPSATRQAIQELNIGTTIVVGGEGVISSAVSGALPSPTRLGGVDRYDTARLVADRYFGASATTDSAFIATGDDFPDALAGANLAAALGPSPVLLSRFNTVPTPTRDYLVNYSSRIGTDYLLGGAGVLSTDVEKAIGSF